ncbi:MAG: Fe-S cluster assembly protein NifU [bacterium]
MWNYSEKVMDHFRNPRNVGEVEQPDGVGEVGSLACGDALRLTFKLDEVGRIRDAKFQTFGCASAIASSSALTEMIKGMTLEEAEKITNQDIASFLGDLPEEKMHCSVMGREALEAAIASYKGKSVQAEPSDIVCKCFGITGKEIERIARENNLTTVEQVTHYTKAGGGCRTCHPEIERILEGLNGSRREASLDGARVGGGKRLTNIQKIRLVEETLEKQIRPALKRDGGDIDLIDVDGNRVYVGFRGLCSFCPSSEFTLKNYVEKTLKEFVTPEIEVEEVTP